MANPEHVEVVRRGKEAIDEWRRSAADARLDLSEADLEGIQLAGADLSRGILRGARLKWANLIHADLSAADLEGADLFGALLLKAALSDAKVTRSDLRYAQMDKASLVSADLSRAALFCANLNMADLSDANLSHANAVGAGLRWAKLTGATFARVDLTAANLFGAHLDGANMTQADLRGSNLTDARLAGADLSQATLGITCLGHLDVGQVLGLATVNHSAPSSVGVDTLIASFRGAGNKLTPDLQAFFRGAGVPRELLDALPGIVAEVKYHSCFISYGQPDLAFATRLREDLVGKGVSCWVYEMDKTVGEQTWHEIEQKLEEYDKMVVVCSIDALMRGGVKKEIDKQIDKNPNKLVPVSLDNRWTQPGFEVQWAGRDLKPFLCERNRADFSGWESDSHRYQKALDELLKGLKRRAD